MAERLTFEPDWLSPPGESIEESLSDRGWTQAELAVRLNMSPKFVNQLVRGKATLGAETAVALATVIGSTAEFWLRREATYRAGLARCAQLEALVPSVSWLRELPVAAMTRFGWIPKLTRPVDKVAACLRFFGVASVGAWRETYERPLAAYRKSPAHAQGQGAVAAWLRQAELQAGKIPTGALDLASFERELTELRALTREPDEVVFVPELVRRCARHGVAVVFVPAPEGCRASGATKWLTPNMALLVLSLRHRSDDHLWFTFFHEAFHLIRHGKRLLFLEGLDGLHPGEEQEADKAAADLLVPPNWWSRLADTSLSAATVTRFAEEAGVSAGIIVGRLQHEGRIPHSRLNGLKVRYQWKPAANG